jgi:hypothetical protein
MNAIAGPVDRTSPSEAKIALFRSLFRGRDDIYPRRFESRKTGKSGYAPACANEWMRGICEKPRIKCARMSQPGRPVITPTVGNARMNALVCRAIHERKLLRFSYDGGVRDVEPHCHGCSKDDNDLLRGYQVGGSSRSGESVGWKMFRLDRVFGLSMTGRSFPGPRPDYDPQDDSMKTIYCHL